MIGIQEVRLKTTFPLDSSIRISNKNMESSEGRNTIWDICQGINILAWNRQAGMVMKRQLPRYLSSTAFMRMCNEVAETLVLEDGGGNEAPLKGRQFDYDRFGELSYIYGELDGEPLATAKDTYIRCRYISRDGREKKASFCTTNVAFGKVCVDREGFPSKKVLFGLCIRKKTAPYKKMHYDKISHTSYEIGDAKEEKSKNKLLQFCIIGCTEQGLYCASPAEKECLEGLCKSGGIVKRAVKPYPGYGYAPTAFLYRKDGICIVEASGQYGGDEWEKRLAALSGLKKKGITCQIYGKEGKYEV